MKKIIKKAVAGLLAVNLTLGWGVEKCSGGVMDNIGTARIEEELGHYDDIAGDQTLFGLIWTIINYVDDILSKMNSLEEDTKSIKTSVESMGQSNALVKSIQRGTISANKVTYVGLVDRGSDYVYKYRVSITPVNAAKSLLIYNPYTIDEFYWHVCSATLYDSYIEILYKVQNPYESGGTDQIDTLVRRTNNNSYQIIEFY